MSKKIGYKSTFNKIFMGVIRYFVIALIVLTGLEIQGKSYYNTAANNFGGLFPDPGMRMQGRYKDIDNGCLTEENVMMGNASTIDTMQVYSTAYRYQLRLANLNNKQGKVKSIKNPMTGGKITITSPQWGMVFNRDENNNYCAIILSCDNSAPFDDITDVRTMQVTLIQYANGASTELATATLSKGVSLEDDFNTLCVDVDERTVRVSIGKEQLQQVLEAPVIRPAGAIRVGYLVGLGSRVAVERAVLTIENDNQVSTATLWTLDALDQHFASSEDPIEGYWKYLDRDMEEKWLRLGGRYTLAVVRADDGYDILYINGAQVKKSQWQPCMLKGHITKTIFSGNYDMTWIDATMEAIDEDAYATIENGVILTLNFPVYKSQVRFAKVLSLDEKS